MSGITRNNVKAACEKALGGKRVSLAFISKVAGELSFQPPYNQAQADKLVSAIIERKTPAEKASEYAGEDSRALSMKPADELETEFSNALKGTLVPGAAKLHGALKGLAAVEEQAAQTVANRVQNFHVNVLERACGILAEREEEQASDPQSEVADLEAIVEETADDVLGWLLPAEAYALRGI